MPNKKKQKGEVLGTRITDPVLLKWFHDYMKANDRTPAWTLRHALEVMMKSDKRKGKQNEL